MKQGVLIRRFIFAGIWLVGACAILATTSILLGNPIEFASLIWLGDNLVWIWHLWILMLVCWVFDRTIGFQSGFMEQFKNCWSEAGLFPRVLLGGMGIFTLLINLVVGFRFLVENVGLLQNRNTLLEFLDNSIFLFVLKIPSALVSTLFLLGLCLLLLRSYKSRPEWGLQQLGTRETTYRYSMLGTVNSAKLQLIRKAERNLERGRTLKAAGLFEQVGGEYFYRAGTLYREKEQLRDARGCFSRAGQYFQMQRNWLKAGDSYYYGEVWNSAVEAYQNLIKGESGRVERERNKSWVERYGDALSHLGRFREAGEFFLSAELFQRAGEAFTKAGLAQRAAEAFREAGDHESSYKVLKAAGENALAEIARAKGLFKQGDFQGAAALFEGAGQHVAAAQAYTQANQPRRAARAYLAAEDWEKAAAAHIEAGEEECALACYERLGDFARAAELASHLGLQERQAYYFEKAGFYAAAARSYIMIGEMARAVNCFHQIREEHTGELREALQILKILEERERERDALTCALSLLENRKLSPKLAPVLLLVTQIYQRMGKLDKALVRIREATRLVPDNREYAAYAEALRVRLGLPPDEAPGPQLKRPHNDPGASQALLRTSDQRNSEGNILTSLQEVTGAAEPTSVTGGSLPRAVDQPMPLPRPRLVKSSERENTPVLELSSPLSPPSGIALHSQPAVSSKPAVDVRRPSVGLSIEGDNVDNTATLEFDAYHPAQEGALARYQIIRELGRGGMGVVFKARDRKLKRLVAIKMLNPDYSQDPKILLFFKREAQAIAALNHPNIVGIYDIGQERGSYYMVMEFIEGQTLDRLLRRNPEVLRKSLLWLWLQSCEGLKYAHEQGIIHRDIKPSNLMVTQNRGFKILDFGLAKHVADPNQTQQVWGTPSYMAPELFYGERASAQTDIYALGACFYVLASGEVPSYRDPSDKFVGNGLPVPVHELNPLIPKALSENIQTCLQLDPLKRFADVQTLAKHLKALRQG